MNRRGLLKSAVAGAAGVGPLSPDGWARQTFIADHADIFAIRFLLPPGPIVCTTTCEWATSGPLVVFGCLAFQ